jgi:hypothetical protein
MSVSTAITAIPKKIFGSFRVSRWHGPCRSQADALGRSHKSSRAPFAPWRLLPIADKTHTRAVLFKPIPNPSPAKLIQARPSPAKLIQIKMLDFTWFYSSDSGLINGLQRIPNKNFLLAPRLVAKPRLARRAFGSGHRHKVGRFLILARGESKNCVVSLSGFLFRPPLRLYPVRSKRAIAQNNS